MTAPNDLDPPGEDLSPDQWTAAWDEEITRRIDQVDRGEVKPLGMDDLKAALETAVARPPAPTEPTVWIDSLPPEERRRRELAGAAWSLRLGIIENSPEVLAAAVTAARKVATQHGAAPAAVVLSITYASAPCNRIAAYLAIGLLRAAIEAPLDPIDVGVVVEDLAARLEQDAVAELMTEQDVERALETTCHEDEEPAR
jgi:hypothetical protein